MLENGHVDLAESDSIRCLLIATFTSVATFGHVSCPGVVSSSHRDSLTGEVAASDDATDVRTKIGIGFPPRVSFASTPQAPLRVRERTNPIRKYFHCRGRGLSEIQRGPFRCGCARDVLRNRAQHRPERRTDRKRYPLRAEIPLFRNLQLLLLPGHEN